MQTHGIVFAFSFKNRITFVKPGLTYNMVLMTDIASLGNRSFLDQLFPRTASYVAYLMTEDSTLLCSASDTVCRAMASLAAICFFFRLFRLWDGDHSCSHTNRRLQFKTGRRRKEKSACFDMRCAHDCSFQTVNAQQFIESCNIYGNERAM